MLIKMVYFVLGFCSCYFVMGVARSIEEQRKLEMRRRTAQFMMRGRF